ncbi:acrosomal protein KIAA1210 homolog [Cariama cristata]
MGDTVEECTGKKKSKFQTFKNFFAKKKRKEPPPPRGESNLKPSQSSSDVSISVLDTTALHSPKEAGRVSQADKGDVVSGHVKTGDAGGKRKLEDAGAVSEDDGLPRSPPEISTLHEVLTDSPSKSSNPVQRHSSLSLGGTDSEDEQIPSGSSSRPISPSSSATLGTSGLQGSNILPVDFTIPASPLGCLDTSAARHRIAINPRKQKGFTSKNQQIPQERLKDVEKECGPAYMLAVDLFSNSVETEGIDTLADVAQKSSVNSVDPNIKDQEKGDLLFIGKVEACLGTTENCSNHAVSDTVPSTSQVPVADSESSSDIKTVAVLKPENSSVIRNDKESCEVVEFQSSKGNAEKKVDTAATGSEAGCMLPPSELEVCFKAETVSVSKGNQGSQRANTSYISEKLSIGCLASSSLAGLKSNISYDDDNKEHQISSTASHRKTVEDSRTSDENVKSPLKTASAKPVRFTIAPAWQRSLSGGSNSKEDSYTRSSPTSPIRPELFEGMTKEHMRSDAVIQESAKTNSDRFDRDCKDSDLHLNSSMEWADHEAQNVENPFGVRLRRTSSLLKYQNESRAESPKLIPSAVPTAASASVKEDQKLVGTGKPPPGLPVSTKSFVKKPDLLEDKNPPKTRSEEVAKKQNGHKPSEKVSSSHLETASSEPAWVSMAKLKQKGFQDHLLAKEHEAEDKALTKVNQEEQGICASEKVLKKNMPSSLSSQDKKTQMKSSVSAAAGKVGPIAQEASVIPAVEKEARHSSNLPMTPCSPAEPPWLSLAKKKAKAWSEMPQIVQ